MADNMIELVASLNVNDSAKQINTVDIPKLQKKIEGIKIKCELDTEGISSIQSQLANIKINAPQIDLGVGGGSELINNVSHIVDNVEDKIEELRKNLAEKFGVSVDKIITSTIKNAKGQINSFSFDLTKLSGEVEKFSYKVSRTKDKDSGSVVTSVKQTSSRDSDRGAIKLLERQEAQVDKLTQKLAKLKAGFDNVNAPRPILNQDNINQLNEEYSKTDEIIKNIGKSTSETFDKMVSDANKAISVYENLGKTMRDAENTATDFASNNINSAKSLLGGKIDNFITTVSKSSVADANSIIKSAESIKKSLDDIGDTQGLKTARDSFNELRGQFNSFDAAVKKSSFEKTHKAKVEQLAADMNRYAEANKRAVASTKQMSNGTSFLDKWNNLVSEMAKGMDLTEDEVKHLREQLRLFGKEAEAQGLKGESAWGKFLNSFKTMSSYITANMVFNFVKRQLRDMVNEVTAINTAMTELRKVTTASDEEFERFAKSAGETGRELGASISDVINATSTFSRAGFNLPDAEELGKVATLYKNVGDGITIDSASESIISVMKAFNIEAENSIGIIDRINEVSNRAAIDSGGLGLALQRVASAMDAANNSLDETIALTTVSNEIVQNPEMVAQGWRTVALRIRGAKSELEDAGLETEGMVESTAKLRDLIKGISGVDIMLDENTFKSTYQIIDELGRVWDKISDIDQASLLEAIAGKRQSNIVAAALNNYERLDEILKISETSAGSAMREQEEYAKSIQYSIDTLKAAYQDFAQTVINSDFVKNLLGTAQSLLEILTKIIDKAGTLPTLLSAIYTARYIKSGKGIFGTVIDETDNATKHLTLFGQEASKGISKIFTALKGLKLQAIGAELAAAALNATLTLGLSLAVNAAVKGISKLLNKEKEAAAEAERLEQERTARRQQLVADVESYTEENKAIDSLVNNYVSLVASTSDVASIKTELLDVQDELIAKYGSEAEGLDLVNGKLSDNIELLNKRKIEKDNDWISDHRAELGEAKEYFENYDKDLANYRVVVAHSGKAAKQEAEMHFEYLMKKIEEAELSQYIDAFQEDYGTDGTVVNYGFRLKENLTAEEIQKATKEFRELYVAQQDYDSLQGDFFTANGTGDLEYLDSLIEKIEQYKSSLDYVKELNDTTWDYDAARAEIGEQFDVLIDKAQELSNKINSPESSNATIYGYSMELQDVKKEIDDIVTKYPALADDSKLIFDNLKGGIKSTIGDTETLRQAFIKTFDDTHKDALANIDKVEKAMQSMLKGEGLKFDDFKTLAWDIDTEGIIKDIKKIGGAYYLSDSELIKLKDTIIEKQIQSIELGKEDAKTNLENARRELSRLQGELKGLAPNGMFPIADARANRDAIELSKKIKTLEDSIGAYSDEIKRSDQLIREYRSHMGDLATTAGMLQARIDGLKKSQDALKDSISKLETDASDYLKAQEAVIDKITDKQEREKEVLEEQLDALNDQLEVLEAQENELNTIIDNYKSVANIVGDAIQSQIDVLEKNKQSIEDYYNEQISKLKEQNEERQDAIDLAEKLAALENAKNNKVRSYSSATGWTYQTNKDALNQATNALDDAKADKQIKELEKQRDAATADYDKQIDGYEDYAKEWEKISKSIESEEDERLAQQILGSEWRTKINKQDTAILKKYSTDFRNYNSQLNSLVGIEMRSLKKSIEAKNSEIKAKQEQIDAWKKYKTEVQRAADDLKAVQDGYIKFIDQVALDENSSWQDREKNLLNFKNTYKTYMDEIVAKNGELTSVTDRINGLTAALNNMGNIDLSGIDSLEAELVAMEAYADSIKSIQDRLAESSTGYGIVNSAGDARLVNANYSDVQEQIKFLEALLKNLRGYSTGGSVTHTGLAMLHGSKSSAEVVFNASQAKKLYEYIDQTPNLMSAALNETLRLTKGNINSTSGTNVGITIDKMIVEANNPEDFSRQFRTNIERYIQTEFTKSQVYNK